MSFLGVACCTAAAVATGGFVAVFDAGFVTFADLADVADLAAAFVLAASTPPWPEHAPLPAVEVVPSLQTLVFACAKAALGADVSARATAVAAMSEER